MIKLPIVKVAPAMTDSSANIAAKTLLEAWT